MNVIKAIIKIGEEETELPESNEAHQLTGALDMLFVMMESSAKQSGKDISGKKIELIFEDGARYLVIGRKAKEIENDGR